MQVEVPSQASGDGDGEGLGEEDVQFHVEMEETGDAADTTADKTTQKNPEEIAMS